MVGNERVNTGGRVEIAACVGKERFSTDGRVVVAGCQLEEGIIALSGVVIAIVSIGFRSNRSTPVRKTKADEGQRNEKNTAP